MAEVKLTILGDDKTSPALRSVRTEVSGLESSMRSLVSVAGLVTTTFAGISIASVFKKGIEAVDDFQQSVIQTSAVITSLQGGENVAENYRLAKEYAQGLQTTLQQVDARTSLNLSSLRQITEEMIKQGVVLDNTNAAQVESFTRLANAAAVYSRNGASEIQLRQEVRALMMGQADQNSLLAQLLQRTVDGPLKQWVEGHKQAGDLLDAIGEKLKGFGPASQELNDTWSAVKSSLKTSLELVAQSGFVSVVKDVSEWLNRINDYLKSHREEIGEKIKSGWETVKKVIEFVAATAKSVWDNFEPFAAIIIGGTIVTGVSRIVEVFSSLYRTLVAVRGAMVAIGAISGATVASTAAASGLAVAASGPTLAAQAAAAARTAQLQLFATGAAAGGAGLSAAAGGVIGLAGAAAAGVGLGYMLQPAVRKLDEFLYRKYGWLLTGEAFYNEQEARNQASTQRLSEVLAKRDQAKAAVPVLSLQDTPEQVAEKIKLQEKELASFRESLVQRTAMEKGQSEVSLSILKARYDQGLESTRSYYQKEQQLALTAAQAEADNAIEYLRKEEAYLEYIKSKKGEKSPEFQQELVNNQKAVESAQKAQLDYAKVFIDNEAKMTAALRDREAEYVKLQITAMESTGNFDEAERLKQDNFRKSTDFLKLQADALDGNSVAVKALQAVELQESIDAITAINKKNAALRTFSEEVATARDNIQKLLGADEGLIQAEATFRQGLDKEIELRDQLTLAWAKGSTGEIAALSAKIQYQELYNKTLQRELELKQLAQQRNVISGNIVGYSNGQAITATGPTESSTGLSPVGYSNGVPIYPYISPSQNPSFQSVTADSYFTTRFSTGITYIDANGNPLSGARAGGGPVQPYGSYLVGEKGPEIVRIGNQGGTVIPNSQLGGITIENLVIHAGTTSDPRQLARQIYSELKQLDARYSR